MKQRTRKAFSDGQDVNYSWKFLEVNNSQDYIRTFLDSSHANEVLSRRKSKTCPELESSVAVTVLLGLFKSNLALRHSHPHLYNLARDNLWLCILTYLKEVSLELSCNSQFFLFPLRNDCPKRQSHFNSMKFSTAFTKIKRGRWHHTLLHLRTVRSSMAPKELWVTLVTQWHKSRNCFGDPVIGLHSDSALFHLPVRNLFLFVCCTFFFKKKKIKTPNLALYLA